MKAPLKDRDRRRDIKGKLKVALDLMVFGGDDRVALPFQEAARNANFSVQAMRKAIEKPHIQRYLREKKQVLLASICGQNPSRLAQLRDQDDNRGAAVRAAMALEQIGTAEQARPAQFTMPGFVVQILNVPASAIEARPALSIEHHRAPARIP